jgi:hypothetical protein
VGGGGGAGVGRQPRTERVGSNAVELAEVRKTRHHGVIDKGNHLPD